MASRVQVTGPSRQDEIRTERAEWLPFLLEDRLKLAGAQFQYAEGDGVPHAVKSGRAFAPFPMKSTHVGAERLLKLVRSM